jgi:uncharacterized coiled-coil protein SlyX
MIWMDTSRELEELQNRRARLEEESRCLNDEQKSLEDRMKVLEEKIAIEELTRNNKATREEISQLESTIKALENKLVGCFQPSEVPARMTETLPETEVTEPAEEEITSELADATESEEEQEEIVTVAEFESPTEQQEEFGADLKTRSDKKKRKFF